MHIVCSGNMEVGEDWNLDYVQDRTEGNRREEHDGNDRDGQRRHCDSEGGES